MLEYPEKRDYARMCVECSAQIRVNGDISTSSAVVKDLSGSGLLLLLDRQLEPGTSVAVSIRPAKPVTPPFDARVEIVRCDPSPVEANKFAAACAITEILSPEEAGDDFP